MTTIFDAYRKANLVLDSCTEQNHMEGARMYVTNFMKMYVPTFTSVDLEEVEKQMPKDVYETGNVATFMFWELCSKLNEKK